MKTYKQFVSEANEVRNLNEFVGAALKAYQYGSRIVNPILRVGGPLYGAWKWRERDSNNVTTSGKRDSQGNPTPDATKAMTDALVGGAAMVFPQAAALTTVARETGLAQPIADTVKSIPGVRQASQAVRDTITGGQKTVDKMDASQKDGPQGRSQNTTDNRCLAQGEKPPGKFKYNPKTKSCDPR
jgi:hypothetical protein